MVYETFELHGCLVSEEIEFHGWLGRCLPPFNNNNNNNTGFPQALEIMENLENQLKKFHAGKNHGI